MIIYSSSVVEKLIVVYNGIIAKVKESAKSILKPPQFAFGYRSCCSLGALRCCPTCILPPRTNPSLHTPFSSSLFFFVLSDILFSYISSALFFVLVFPLPSCLSSSSRVCLFLSGSLAPRPDFLSSISLPSFSLPPSNLLTLNPHHG